MSLIYVIMGVSGSGKTTVGKVLANQLGFPFLDADDFHPQANIDKMQAGKALNDKDRKPWLESLNQELKKHKDTGVVLACSALKASYRESLEEGIKVHWTHLAGDFELIQARMQLRSHFMPASLLQSQFDTLEPLESGLTLDIDSDVEFLVHMIRAKYETKGPAHWGIVGMGVMGQSLARNSVNAGIRTAVFNRATEGEELVIAKMLTKYPDPKLYGYTDWKEFTAKLSLPRKILLMVPAGKAIDAVLEELLPFLSPGDCIVDGGNSHFSDTQRRIQELIERDIEYLGMGVSGGEKGALEGPAMMPGGSKVAFNALQPILDKIAAKDPKGNPCVGYLGQGGCGHLVKTVHNGIEYAEMQLLAEVYSLLLASDIPRSEFGSIFNDWDQGEYSSYLLGLMPSIMNKKEGDAYLIDKILPMAGAKGTGAWTSITALENGQDMSISTAAVNARNHSQAIWHKFPQIQENHRKPSRGVKLELERILKGYQAARILNHLQGLQFIHTMGTISNWDLDLSEVTRIWTNGCILKSQLIELLTEKIAADFDHLNLWSYNCYIALFQDFKYTLNLGWQNDIHMPVFNAAWQYGLGVSSAESNANIIQAQRDFFGAHTYKRKDHHPSENFHTDWTKP
ncbi:NADP-dependent phosphogluconate dehydrogenase [Gilvibacter sediminis]|uniref:NADP-dependent phosphogluconate dehydrogenase n=1 Tax=Gilvibacter sediminis TaxID=379071 RepID=UPI00234FCA09|nr:NADP-dependent phosphogluconate dehydrogenase [Gilvibacter sediminis]MDC7998323.1 NADP-dependent phosphogluconate dehydrogenase [Gilvibacter sediminis]